MKQKAALEKGLFFYNYDIKQQFSLPFLYF